jgi:hypothetical protein
MKKIIYIINLKSLINTYKLYINMDSKIHIKYIVFAKEMLKLMEFQKYINIHQNFNKKSVLINYFEELYNYISNFDSIINDKKNNIINMIKTLITEKIIVNTEYLENDLIFEEDYLITLEIFKLILEYDELEIEKKEKKLIKKFNKIRLD